MKPARHDTFGAASCSRLSVIPRRGILCSSSFLRTRCHQHSLAADSFTCAERGGMGARTEAQHSFALTAVAWLQRSCHHIQVPWHITVRADQSRTHRMFWLAPGWGCTCVGCRSAPLTAPAVPCVQHQSSMDPDGSSTCGEDAVERARLAEEHGLRRDPPAAQHAEN